MSTTLEHRAKVKLARSLMTPEEARTPGMPLFGTAAWTKRAKNRAIREMAKAGRHEKITIEIPKAYEPAAVYRPSLWARIRRFIRSLFGA